MDPNSIFGTMTGNRCKVHQKFTGEDKNLLNLTPNLTMHPAAQSGILNNNSTTSIHCFEAAPAVEMAKNSRIGGSENDNSTTKTTNFTGSINIASYLVGMCSDPTNELMAPTEADFFPFENSLHHASAQDEDESSDPPPPLGELLEIQNNSNPSPLTLLSKC